MNITYIICSTNEDGSLVFPKAFLTALSELSAYPVSLKQLDEDSCQYLLSLNHGLPDEILEQHEVLISNILFDQAGINPNKPVFLSSEEGTILLTQSANCTDCLDETCEDCEFFPLSCTCGYDDCDCAFFENYEEIQELEESICPLCSGTEFIKLCQQEEVDPMEILDMLLGGILQ